MSAAKSLQSMEERRLSDPDKGTKKRKAVAKEASDGDGGSAEETQGADRNLFSEIASSVIASQSELFGHALRYPKETSQALGSFWLGQLNTLSGVAKPKEDRGVFPEEGWDAPYYKALQNFWLGAETAATEWLEATSTENDIHDRRRKYMVEFLLGATSPKNFVATNPAAWKKTQKELGQNLLRGWQNFLEDVTKNHGLPNKVDLDAFEVGKDIATTEGSVIFKDEIAEIIQYRPTTEKVYKKPILISYSVVNRFYAMDMTERRSVIRFLLNQGYQVFILSWRNPGPEHAKWSLDHYADAVAHAFDVVRDVCKTKTLTLLGVCAGAYPAYTATLLRQADGDAAVDNMIGLVSAIDNQEEDTLFGLLNTADTLGAARKAIEVQRGLTADELSWSLSMLQPDRLIFPYLFEGYALGERRVPNEIAYWISDQVNVPAALHSEIMSFVIENGFTDPKRKTARGRSIDIAKLDTNLLVVGAYFDDLMPWKATYRIFDHVNCPTDYIMVKGGHIAPMVTNAGDKKSGYWQHENRPDGMDAEEWLKAADWHQRSWLLYLDEWLAEKSGTKAQAPESLGNAKYPVIGKAPGTYVLE